MNDKEIQKLIDRYLDGLTSTNEERLLARELLRADIPEDWQVIRLMLGELTMGELEYDDIMARRTEAVPVIRMHRRWIAVAASLLLLIGIGIALKPCPSLTEDEATKGGVEAVAATPPVRTAAMVCQEKKKPTPSPQPPVEERVAPKSSLSVEDPNLHYASLETKTDTVPYQDPARVDEFIAKFADYYEVKQAELECSVPQDSNVVSTVYVFPDEKEIDVFGRLLQVACCYSDETPGYYLTFSHRQFFFELKDMRKQLQYRWIAERVSGKILLYGTCSPVEVVVSSTCYQEYRDELMHTKSINSKTIDI